MMAEGEETISEKEKIMLTGGQNRKTTIDSETDTQAGVTTPSGNPPYNTDATIGDNPGGSQGGGSSFQGEAR
ncbi:MAG TPA: hypothetical protein V6C91_03285 [Coleofasciculaceae cyanobacterium]